MWITLQIPSRVSWICSKSLASWFCILHYFKTHENTVFTKLHFACCYHTNHPETVCSYPGLCGSQNDTYFHCCNMSPSPCLCICLLPFCCILDYNIHGVKLTSAWAINYLPWDLLLAGFWLSALTWTMEVLYREYSHFLKWEQDSLAVQKSP